MVYVEGELLDVGCGQKPYKDLYHGAVTRHIGVDRLSSSASACEAEVDVFGDAHALPFSARSFDTVLCTHVLVHLQEPDQAMREIRRVLKKGGHLILSARQMWHVYTPEDYHRFTASGLRYLAQKHGFEVIELTGVGGFVGRVGVKLVYFLHSLNRSRVRWLTEVPLGLMILATQVAFYVLDGIFGTPNDVVFNILVARKRSA
jgi:SAM-dependent methyltransferase